MRFSVVKLLICFAAFFGALAPVASAQVDVQQLTGEAAQALVKPTNFTNPGAATDGRKRLNINGGTTGVFRVTGTDADWRTMIEAAKASASGSGETNPAWRQLLAESAGFTATNVTVTSDASIADGQGRLKFDGIGRQSASPTQWDGLYALLNVSRTATDNQVRIALDPADNSEVLVSNVPPGTDHLHFWEGSGGSYPATVMRYVDKPASTTTFRPDSDTPWVDVAAMPTTANGTPTGQWYSDFSGSRVQTFPAPPADTTPPDTTITSGPANGSSTTSTDATFTFTSSEPNSTFQCGLDGAQMTLCTSPISYSGLIAGGRQHTFLVRATDAAGNTDQSAAFRSWTINDPTPPPSSHLVGVNAPWFMGAGGGNSVANQQVLDTDPDIIRDPAHNRATWDWVAAHSRAKIIPEIESTGDTGFLSWAVTHPAFGGVVELSNEPYWNNISASSWVSSWGPVINFIKANYPSVKLTAPIDDWPTAHGSSPGTSGWTQQLLAARPALKTEMYGWAIHPYCDTGPQCALDHLNNGIAALKANGVANPHMWATEWGWSTGTGISEATKASNANTFLSNQPPELEASEWYQMNANTNSVARENGFGLYVFDTVGNWCCWHAVAAQAVIKQFAQQP